jgi:heme/copper-type cytochrome/quinol oxidase subunit 2
MSGSEVTARVRKRAKRRALRYRWTEKRLQAWLPLAASFLIFFITCTYTFFSYRQWQTMESTLRTSQRAYVGVYEIKTDLNLRLITVLLENIGKVPAKKIRVNTVQYLWVGESDRREKVVEDRREFDWEDVELFPGGFKAPIVLELKDERALSPANSMTVAGFIEYDDGFGFQSMTIFSFHYVPPPVDKWTLVPTTDLR